MSMAAHADPASFNKLSFSVDSFQFGASKVDKAYGRARYKKQLYKVVLLCRVMEISLILIFIWRNAANYFPVSGEYFHEGLMILSSPRTVFLICNVIILTLLAESRQNPSSSSHEDVSKPSPDILACIQSHTADKQSKHVGGDDCRKVKIYRRSKSEMVRSRERKLGELRRSTGTESCKNLICGREEEVGKGMSDDEFRDMVEAFIARQQRILRQE